MKLVVPRWGLHPLSNPTTSRVFPPVLHDRVTAVQLPVLKCSPFTSSALCCSVGRNPIEDHSSLSYNKRPHHIRLSQLMKTKTFGRVLIYFSFGLQSVTVQRSMKDRSQIPGVKSLFRVRK